MKKQNKEKQEFVQKIDPTPMSVVMAEDFNRYAKAVLTDRAVPDVRDGLKPVQRRIIFGMYNQGNTYDKPTRKSATTVGYVMGHFHPHGDASIYDALVRLSQDWKMEVPLVTMQGNNGSIDDDPAAASRYTEAKLAKISSLMVQDLDKNTVDMQLNFADEEYEPTILPAYFPNLLVNGANGIAVGAVTNIPTHNLGEVIDATIYAISHKDCTVADLRKFILGPDFPTGGYIDQKANLDKVYETGSGSFYINANAKIDNELNAIVIDSIPYGTIKKSFVAELDKTRINNNIANIDEILDESTEDVRIVIYVKKGQDPNAILSYYRKKNLLKSTYSANMLAISKGHPKTMNLYEIIQAYIDHQVDVVTRRSQYNLDKANKRLNVVNGLIRCVDIIDELIKVIKASKGKAESKTNIMNKFGFDEDQAEAIVMLNLYKINNLDYQEFLDEKKELEAIIKENKRLLEDKSYLEKNIIKTLQKIKDEFATPRRTQIIDKLEDEQDVDVTKLIAKEDVMVVLTKDGYIKRTNMRSYQATLVNDITKDIPKLKQGDGIILNLKCSTHDGIIAFFESGNYIYIPVYQIQECKWKEEGKHLNYFVKNLNSQDRVVSAYAINTFDLDTYFVLLTKNGKIKRTLLKEFEQKKVTSRAIKAMGLTGDDTLVKVSLSSKNSDVIIIQNNGFVSRYNENYIPVVGIKAGGVKAVDNLKDDVYCTSMVLLNQDELTKLVSVCDKACVKVISSNNIIPGERLTRKTQMFKVFNNNKMNIIECESIKPKKGIDSYIIAYTEEENIAINISEMGTDSIGSGLKSNLDITSGNIEGIHHNSYIIDSTFKLEKPTIVQASQVKPKKEDSDKQVTLFDLFNQED
jgi:topoisomerase IV subunit A